MRSKAHFRSHPIHPALIPLPIGLLIGAFGFDVAAVITGDPGLGRAGGILAIAGIVAALVAAVPGAIDYFYAVPPRSTAKQRATRHMLANLSAVALFAAAVLLRTGPEPAVALIIVEAVALGLLGIGGWLGGVLVSRNQISVDHRYADAGKWNEEAVSLRADEWVRVAKPDELGTNQLKLLRTSDGRIVIGRSESGWVAFDDRCTHHGASLADGAMICGTVQCPWHGSQFDTASGAVRAGPATEPIATYPVEQRADGIYLKGRSV